ncbi:hypothetical protein R1flu_019844 [Riccia fluitans]|uniref:Mechanosensitive ion channel MscS domain-containing protein n=1 Tax=Riccia fluitans TaxID=41844 RepID=A0ABD1ZLF0_9MARC
MARNSASVRAALRNLSAKRLLPLQRRPLDSSTPTARHFPTAAASHCLLGRRQLLEEPEDSAGCGSLLNSEIWTTHASYRSTTFLIGRNLLRNPSPQLSRSFSVWRGKEEANAEDNTSKIEPLVERDGVSSESVGGEKGADADGNWGDGIADKLMDGIKVVEEKFNNVLLPQIQEFPDKYPVISDISVPVGVLTGAWMILPRVLRRVHRYVGHGSAAFYRGISDAPLVQVPYEQSVWQAMELPSRLFATILTILQVGRLIAPNAMAAHYLTQFWAGGGILCIVLFLHKWKSNVMKRLLTGKPLTLAERERYLTIDKFSSLGLAFFGALGIAEAYDLKIHSLLTVGGIGGIATAFAAKDILGNMLTGVTLSFSKPFSVGDQIKAGPVEGRVEEVGLHSTKLLSAEKDPIIVPNSFFQSQVIVNKSRAPWRAFSVKIPVRLQDYQKVPVFTLEIQEMLNHHPQVHFGEDKPRCSIAQFTPSSLEIAISCNVKPMSKDEFLQVQQSILLEAAAIITRSGAVLAPYYSELQMKKERDSCQYPCPDAGSGEFTFHLKGSGSHFVHKSNYIPALDYPTGERV